MNASVFLDTNRNVGPIDRRIFGGFLEHIGRAVYEGVYDPGNPLSDGLGFRQDVLEALRPMRMPLVRYPGGNFVSNYDWRDGIGPQNQRPARPDFAWKTIEPNTFGVDEFTAWCRTLDTSPMVIVNLGTGEPKQAAELLEYCNLPGGTYWADQRIANGNKEAHGVKLWGLGNEMDGPWQAAHVPAEVYARRASQASQLMKGLDPSIELVLCGSSGQIVPTYMEWDRIVLEHCWDHVDYIATHHYSRNDPDDTARFLAEGVVIDRMIEDYASLIRYMRALKKSDKRIYVAFDEWNVWYRVHGRGQAWWQRAPHLLEEVYNLEDALVVAQYLSSFIRHADVVKVACLAQIVNVIAPILTRRDGVLIQSIYHPFVMCSEHAQGLSLVPAVDCPTYDVDERGEVPTLDVAACYDPEGSRMSLFLVNRDLQQKMTVDVTLYDRSIEAVIEAVVLSGDDPKAANSWEDPNVVKPAPGEANVTADGHVRVEVPALGLAVVALKPSAQ